MIKVLETAIDKIKALPEERQRYAAQILEQIATAEGVYRLTEAERHLIREGLAELDRGEAATETQVRAVYDKYRA